MSTIAEIGYFGGQRTCGLNSEMHGRQDMMIISKSVETLMGGRLRRGDGAGRDRRLGACADHARRQGKWVENITAETLQVEYLQTTIQELANIMAGEQVDPKVLRAARRFEREHKLHEWIQVQNTQKGFAPGSARVLHAAHQFEQDPAKLEDMQCNSGSLPARTKWMQRFAKRWQLQKGTFQAGERIPQEEAKAKVSGFQQKPGVLIFGNLRTQRRPKRGTVWRSRFRDQNKTLSVKVGPENGPLFVQFADCLSDFGQAGEPNRQ